MRKLVTLKKNYEFQFVFKKGIRTNCSHFNLIVAPCRKNYAKFGIVISKKIGKAVIRNKKRRQIKEILKKLVSDIKINQYVIVAKDNINELTFSDLKAEIETCFLKNKYLENK